MRALYVAATVAALPVSIAYAQDQRAEALLQVERARAGLRTGDVHCSVESWCHDTVRGGEDLHFFQYATCRFGRADRIWTQRGSEPEPPGAFAAPPRHLLLSDGRLWRHREGVNQAELYETQRRTT